MVHCGTPITTVRTIRVQLEVGHDPHWLTKIWHFYSSDGLLNHQPHGFPSYAGPRTPWETPIPKYVICVVTPKTHTMPVANHKMGSFYIILYHYSILNNHHFVYGLVGVAFATRSTRRLTDGRLTMDTQRPHGWVPWVPCWLMVPQLWPIHQESWDACWEWLQNGYCPRGETCRSWRMGKKLRQRRGQEGWLYVLKSPKTWGFQGLTLV